MNSRKPELLDVVALLRDISDENLERGDVGSVVEMTHDPKFVWVEFSDRDGRMTAMPALSIDDLLVLRHNMVALAEAAE